MSHSEETYDRSRIGPCGCKLREVETNWKGISQEDYIRYLDRTWLFDGMKMGRSNIHIHANAKAKKGKIIAAQHVIDALRELDFTAEEVKEVKDHLRAYREAAAKKKEKSKESKDDAVDGVTGEAEKDGDKSAVEDGAEVEEDEEAAEQEDDDDDEGADQLMDED